MGVGGRELRMRMRQGRECPTGGWVGALGALGAAVMGVVVTVAGCSPGAGGAAATASGAGTVGRTAAGSGGASSPAAAFAVPTTACVLSAQRVREITGQSGVVTGELAGAPEGCEYLSAGNVVAIIGVVVDPAQAGESAQQYLSSDIGSDNTYGVSQAVAGLGDAAQFGTSSCNTGTCGAVLVVQIRRATVAHVTVVASNPSQGPILSMARAALAVVSS